MITPANTAPVSATPVGAVASPSGSPAAVPFGVAADATATPACALTPSAEVAFAALIDTQNGAAQGTDGAFAQLPPDAPPHMSLSTLVDGTATVPPPLTRVAVHRVDPITETKSRATQLAAGTTVPPDIMTGTSNVAATDPSKANMDQQTAAPDTDSKDTLGQDREEGQATLTPPLPGIPATQPLPPQTLAAPAARNIPANTGTSSASVSDIGPAIRKDVEKGEARSARSLDISFARTSAASGAEPGAPDDAAISAKPTRHEAAFSDLIGGPGGTSPSAASLAADRVAPAPPLHPHIAAQPGRIGRELGIEVARRVSSGGDELTVRLDPAHHGQIEVRMHFDESGQLRATVTASQNATLDMLRRDSADLSQSLRGAGIATDAHSFRFESRHEGGTGQEQNLPRPLVGGTRRGSGLDDDSREASAPSPQRWRRIDGTGRINMVA